MGRYTLIRKWFCERVLLGCFETGGFALALRSFVPVRIYFAFLFLFFLGCAPSSSDRADEGASSVAVLVNEGSADEWVVRVPLFKGYWEELQQVLAGNFPVIKLQPSELDEQARLAQQLALQDARFVRDLFDPRSGSPLHSEVMRSVPLGEDEIRSRGLRCKRGNCYEVQMYNFFLNHTTTALVDLSARQVLNVSVKSGARAVNERLKKLALEVAMNAPSVLEALGVEQREALRAFNVAVKPAKCERSRHLGLAPVFEKNGRLLWILVDATAWKVVGYKWMHGRLKDWEGKVAPISERIVQTEAVMANFCEQSNVLEKGDWRMEYVLQPSDGLELKNLTHRGRPVLTSAKLVDWHVSYTFKEGFGYSDAVGCPQFSSAAVVAFAGPQLVPLLEEGDTIGFALVQDFRSPVWPLNCNYRYENRYEFYNDGRFRIAGVNHGLGCGVTGWYRPVFRIDLGSGAEERIQHYENGAWKTLEKESWSLQDEQTAYSPEGYQYKWYIGEKHGYYMEPARGQFGDGGRGDHAYTYVCLRKTEEGESDMVTFGPCCNENEVQGPDQYLQPAESLAGKDLVIWYVPQMRNDNRPGQEYCWADIVVKHGRAENITWPGTVGPMFVPFENE